MCGPQLICSKLENSANDPEVAGWGVPHVVAVLWEGDLVEGSGPLVKRVRVIEEGTVGEVKAVTGNMSFYRVSEVRYKPWAVRVDCIVGVR